MKKILLSLAFLFVGMAAQAQTPYDTVNVYDPQNFTEMTAIDTAFGQIISRKGNLNRRIGLQTLKNWVLTGVGPIDSVYIIADTLYILQGVTLWDVTLPAESTLAANGLTLAGDTVKLGGTLAENTTITGGAFGLTATSARATTDATFSATNSSSGRGVFGSSATGVGVFGSGLNGVQGSSSTGSAILGQATGTNTAGFFSSSGGKAISLFVNPASVNDNYVVADFVRMSTSTAVNGIGMKIPFIIERSDNAASTAAEIRTSWADANVSTLQGQFDIYTTEAASSARKFSLSGPGQLTLDGYAGTGLTSSDSSLYVLTTDATGDVWKVPIDSVGGGGTGGLIDSISYYGDTLRIYENGGPTPFTAEIIGGQTLSTSNDTLTISGANSIRVPGNGFIRDSITTTTLTIDLAHHNNAVVVLKMESATNLTLTINNPWSAVSGSYPNQSGETGVYTFHFRGTSGTDNVTWPGNFYNMAGVGLGTDALTEGTSYTCYYDPVDTNYYCK